MSAPQGKDQKGTLWVPAQNETRSSSCLLSRQEEGRPQRLFSDRHPLSRSPCPGERPWPLTFRPRRSYSGMPNLSAGSLAPYWLPGSLAPSGSLAPYWQDPVTRLLDPVLNLLRAGSAPQQVEVPIRFSE